MLRGHRISHVSTMDVFSMSLISLYTRWGHKLEPKLEICLVGQILSLFKGTEYISPRLNHPKSG